MVQLVARVVESKSNVRIFKLSHITASVVENHLLVSVIEQQLRRAALCIGLEKPKCHSNLKRRI